MVAFVLTAGRVVVRRLINDWLMLVVLASTVMAAMVQLAAAPMYSDAVTTGAMQRILDDAATRDTTVVVDLRTAPADHADIDSLVIDAAEDATAATGFDVNHRLESASSYDLIVPSGGGGRPDDRSVVMSLSAPPGIGGHATLVSGQWPDGDSPADGLIAAALSEPAAAELGVGVGDELTLNDRQADRNFRARIVGIFRVTDPAASFWLDDELLASGVSPSRSTIAVGPLVVAPPVMFGQSEAIQPSRLVSTWLIEPRLDQLAVGEVDDLRRSLTRFPDRLESAIGDLGPETAATTSAVSITSSLPDLLFDTNRSLAVTRSGLYAVVAQLAMLSALALTIGAGLLTETRRTETNLLEARGIGRRQLVAFAVLEAVVLVVPVAAVAPWVAAALLRLLNRFGPLATIDLALAAPVNREAVVTVAMAAVFVIAVVAWPSIRATTSRSNLLHRQRRRIRQVTESYGVDVALLALTAAAFWQLRAISSTPIAGLADRFSVDPVLVVTPALGLLTGAVLTLRIVPLLARAGERVATAGRSVIGALTGWQLARRPGGQARAAFLLVMAVSIGFFAASYAATWQESQADQADFQVGADLRVLPNRRTNDSITDLHLTSAHESLDGVDTSMPIQRITGALPGSDRRGTFLLLDAAKAAEVVSLRPEAAPEFARAMDELAAARPEIPGIDLPDGARRLDVTFEVTEELVALDDVQIPDFFHDEFLDAVLDEEPDTDGQPDTEDEAADEPEAVEFLPPGFTGQVDVVVRDGSGLLHRLAIGPLESNVGRQVLTVDLGDSPAAEAAFAPLHPLRIVDIQIRSTAPPFVSREVAVDLLSIEAVGEATGADRVPVSLEPTDDRRWVPSILTQGRTFGQPTITLSASDERIRINLETAASDDFSTAQVLFGVRPGSWSNSDTFPVVVSRQWLTQSRTDIGGGVNLDALRLLDGEAVVAGAVDVFPTVDPVSNHAVIADLPTLQVVDYELGRAIRTADEYWLKTGGGDVVGAPGTAAVGAALLAAPYESVEIEGKQQRYVSLTTDPAALATIGAFAVGFVVASAFAVLVFVAVTAVSARERRSEFTLLRAFGLRPRQFIGWMTAEQLTMVVVGVVVGVAVGYGLSAAVLPLISIGQQGAPAVPPAVPRYPWSTIAVVVAAPAGALLVTMIVTALRRERDSLGTRLREGSN